MKLINKTRYSGRLLRSVIERAHAAIARSEGRLPQWKRVVITVRRRVAKSHTSGHAYLNGTRSVFTLPCPTVEAAEVYRLAWHEIYHLYGYAHRQMKRLYPSAEETIASLSGLPETMGEVATTKAPRRDVQQTRYARVVASISRYEAKAKRIDAALLKLRKKRAYYERALAARETGHAGGKRPVSRKAPAWPVDADLVAVPASFVDRLQEVAETAPAVVRRRGRQVLLRRDDPALCSLIDEAHYLDEQGAEVGHSASVVRTARRTLSILGSVPR